MIEPMVEKEIQTAKGRILLVRNLTADRLSRLHMEEGLGVFFHYRYEEAKKTKEVLSTICNEENSCVVGAIRNETLLAYLTIVSTAGGTRWSEVNAALCASSDALTDPVLLELGSIEVSTAWRSIGLAHSLFEFAFEDPLLEEKIVFSRELSWHWDLRASNLDRYRYRTMLMKLFEGAGFRYCETDDEEIGYAGENVFMARVGVRIPPETAMLFHRSLCRSEPRGWGWG
jgi:hypothetical protein